MKKWLILLGTLLLAIPSYAAKGDFQIFKLGDTRGQIIQKIQNYDQRKLLTFGEDQGKLFNP